MKHYRNYWTFPALTRCEKDRQTKITNLIKRICEYFEVSKKELTSNRRFREIVEPRKIAMYIIHKHYNLSSTKTGRLFGKDHATVLHACKSIEGFMEFDREFKNRVNNLI